MEEKKPTVAERLLEIQRDLKVEKSQFNSYGKYNYRSKEDILEAAKPLCHARGLVLICEDDIRIISNGWVYVASTATLVDVADETKTISAHGYAREPEEKKGMDASQITGTASSYAGKRALGNLFALDDTKDADAMPMQKSGNSSKSFVAHCTSCGTRFTFDDATHYRVFLQNPGCCASPNWQVE